MCFVCVKQGGSLASPCVTKRGSFYRLFTSCRQRSFGTEKRTHVSLRFPTAVAEMDHAYHQLLAGVKDTVEGLLANQSPIVWNVYGGLTRLHQSIERILQHGCKIFTPEGDPDYLTFVSGDSSSDPSLPELLPTNDGISFAPPLAGNPEDGSELKRKDKASLWLYRSLEEHQMSSKLSFLLRDRSHLLSCYESSAFLCKHSYAEATLICLRAVEQNLPSLLAEITPNLFIPNTKVDGVSKTHRRSASYPEQWGCSFRPKVKGQSYSFDLPIDDPEITDIKANTVPDNQVDSKVQEEQPEIMRQRSNSWERMQMRALNPNWTRRRNTWDMTFSSDVSAFKSSLPPKEKMSASVRSLSPSLLKIDYMTSFRPCSPNEDSSVSVLPSGFSCSPRTKGIRSTSSAEDLKDFGSVTTITKETPPSKKKGHAHSKSDSGIVFKPSPPESIPMSKSTIVFPAENVQPSVTRETKHKSFMEDGGSSIMPTAVGFFPKPQEGQSLTSFLSSSDFAKTSAELDRENAHFSVSEALIAAMEQMKCRRMLQKVEEEAEESDEEIQHLKQRIRLRRRQRQQETQRQRRFFDERLLSDGRTDTTTTDQSISPPTSTNSCTSDSLSTDDVDDFEVDNPPSLAALKDSGLSVSMASLYSEADVAKRVPFINRGSRNDLVELSGHHQLTDSMQTNLSDSFVSAECVALSLLKKFSDKQLPRASELVWLVSEQEAPQQLLPLPSSWPVSPDEAEDEDMSLATELRGNLEWAPPRAQIICTVHPTPNRKVLLMRQNHRCCGCGIKVEPAYMKSFRYCHYLGKYFCTGCHENQLAVLPGKIIEKWDCSKYPVSRFSAKLLDSMHEDPLFNIKDLNEGLYRRVKSLQSVWVLRLQLCYLKDYLLNCRFASGMIQNIKSEAAHLLSDDIHTYSIKDLLEIKSGELVERLKRLLAEGTQHVHSCQLCQARGFICEACRSEEVIFPFQWPRVSRCGNCRACFHTSCFRIGKCSRCIRFSSRRLSVGEEVQGQVE